MSENKKWPKCAGEMEKGDKLVGEHGLVSVRFAKKGDALGDRIIPSTAKNADSLGIYKGMACAQENGL